MQLTVPLGPRSYPVFIDGGIARSLPFRLKERFPKSGFALVTNETVHGLYRDLVEEWKRELPCIVHRIPDGERYKTIDTWRGILDALLAARFERSGVIVALGGGVVGDVAGFAAAALLRGVAYVQVPTTLLAMVDSSVGGKTAVDHPCGKNLVGAFHQPGMVLIDTGFLATLPPRQYAAGYAELFKYAFIGGKEMFELVSANHGALTERREGVLLEGIRRSIAIKAAVVAGDERETGGGRMLLNFGHTFAHALEKIFGFTGIIHGEAVWWGMRCACELGKRLGTIPAAEIPAYDALAGAMPTPPLPSVPDAAGLHDAMRFDKKVEGGAVRFVVPARAGTAVVTSNVPAEAVAEVLDGVFRR